jgi:hypothetical protein
MAVVLISFKIADEDKYRAEWESGGKNGQVPLISFVMRKGGAWRPRLFVSF